MRGGKAIWWREPRQDAIKGGMVGTGNNKWDEFPPVISVIAKESKDKQGTMDVQMYSIITAKGTGPITTSRMQARGKSVHREADLSNLTG